MDTNIVPLLSTFVNPFQPGVPFVGNQKYVVPVGFEGTPGTLEKGCMMNGFNTDVNSLDATYRHVGMNWNTDAGFRQKFPNVPYHFVDTPNHAPDGQGNGPNTAGVIMVRAYLDATPANKQTAPRLIVRDVQYGCAYPAAFVLQTMQPQVVTTNKTTGSTWLNSQQADAHRLYCNAYQVPFCYGTDPNNALPWYRGVEYVPGDNPNAAYIMANVPSGLPQSLAAAGEVMRIRLRVPQVPPTPCTNGCSRSGNEQMRYMSLSFEDPGGDSLASVADSSFTQSASPPGYATLIVGTGATVPAWITPANGYTYVNLAAVSGYQSLQSVALRHIVSSPSFLCTGQVVPFNTTPYTPPPYGGLMGDYLPVVDYPLAATLPQTATPLIGPNHCDVFPIGRPANLPSCSVVTSIPITISSVPAQATGFNPVSAQPLPPITLNGGGFGLLPFGLPYTGTSNYLQVTDVTQNWSAGNTGSPCNLSISYWATNEVELTANVDQNGMCPLVSGDQLNIQIWNPQTMTGPSTATVTVGPN